MRTASVPRSSGPGCRGSSSRSPCSSGAPPRPRPSSTPFPHRSLPVHGLHNLVLRVPPVVTAPTKEGAVFLLNWLSATGSGIFLASIIAGLIMGLGIPSLIKHYGSTLMKVRYSLLTISAMMAIGFLTRYGGLDATMGLAFARTGVLYPFFGTMLGWLGVALTGSDTASNVLLRKLAEDLCATVAPAPTLMCAANSQAA